MSKKGASTKKAVPISNDLPPNADKSIESLFESLCDADDPEIISMVHFVKYYYVYVLVILHFRRE